MTLLMRLAAALGLALCLVSAPAAAQSFNTEQRGEIERIVREYLLRNPELLAEVINELEKRQQAAEADKHRTAVKDNAKAIFNSPHQAEIGNPQGDVTVVEFFDYNCPYCKQALTDVMALLKADSKVRVVLKELPVLGEASSEAAKVSIAVRMQDKSGGKKYLEFHQKLLQGRGRADKARALAAAKEAGFDMARIEKDLDSAEVRATLQEGERLAQALGINGTPTYVVGNEVVVGAVSLQVLKQKVEAARTQKP